MRNDSKKVLRVFPSIEAANAAVSLLTAGGIEPVVSSDDSEGEMPQLQKTDGVRLMVKADDEFRARRILAVALPESGEAQKDDWQPATEGLLKGSRRRAPVIAGLLFVVLFVIPLLIAVFIALSRH